MKNTKRVQLFSPLHNLNKKIPNGLFNKVVFHLYVTFSKNYYDNYSIH